MNYIISMFALIVNNRMMLQESISHFEHSLATRDYFEQQISDWNKQHHKSSRHLFQSNVLSKKLCT